MNTIQQISLKLQLGLDPAREINPEDLRSLWNDQASRKEAVGRATRERRGYPSWPSPQERAH